MAAAPAPQTERSLTTGGRRLLERGGDGSANRFRARNALTATHGIQPLQLRVGKLDDGPHRRHHSMMTLGAHLAIRRSCCFFSPSATVSLMADGTSCSRYVASLMSIRSSSVSAQR